MDGWFIGRTRTEFSGVNWNAQNNNNSNNNNNCNSSCVCIKCKTNMCMHSTLLNLTSTNTLLQINKIIHVANGYILIIGLLINSQSENCSISKVSIREHKWFQSLHQHWMKFRITQLRGYFVIVKLFFPPIPSLLILLAQDNDTQIPNNPKPASFPSKLFSAPN